MIYILNKTKNYNLVNKISLHIIIINNIDENKKIFVKH